MTLKFKHTESCSTM